MNQTQEQIEHLRTIQETSSFWADVAENQLPLLSKESTLQEESAAIQAKINNIKLDTTELAKEATLNAVSSKLDNINVEVDLTQVAKQGNNADATNSAILEGINSIFDKFDGQYAVQLKDIIGE